jgi:nitrite reductase/ring-hydroxylating ferredoxin subunit
MTLRYGRRRFLGAGLLTAGAFSAGLLTDSLLKAASPGAPAAPQDAELLPAHGAWHTVTTSQALPEGSVIDFDLGAVTGFVHRTQGRLRAVSGVCTHQACRLTLDIPRTGLVCPCHGATFTLAGRNLHNYRSHHPLPALPRLPVRELDGAIQVYAPDIPPPPEPA